MTSRWMPGLLGLAVALGACAPGGTPAGPTPTPAPAPETATAPTPTEALANTPDNWWLLDRGLDRVPGISAERGYRELLAGREPRKSVVVAILDTGVDVDHEDLDDNLWVNEDEVPGNGVDDDGNGYVDDVHGWSFLGDVVDETYEVTRIYARLRPRYAGASPDTLTGAAREEHALWTRVRGDLEQRRRDQEENLRLARQYRMLLQSAESILRPLVGGDSLTAAKVGLVQASTPRVQQAKALWLEFAANGFTDAFLAEQVESSERLLRYGLNPDFDSRGVGAGVDYDTLPGRSYGNADVKGTFGDHGTHVAGIVAAERGNGVGIDGIAPNNVRIMAVRVVPNGDERDRDVANAIRYAVDNGADILNMSFGKGYSPHMAVVHDAARYAEQKGVLLVHGAGNDAARLDTFPNFPTRYLPGGGEVSTWIEVGASAIHLDSLAADFSNYDRRQVDVFAPGVEILSTMPGGGYQPMQGTSMASPVVAGLAALIMSYYPDLTAAQVKDVILRSATPFPGQMVAVPGGKVMVPFSDLSATGGIVNAYAALQLAEQVARGASATN